jgi:K+-sensing histidine kinase KdpD
MNTAVLGLGAGALKPVADVPGAASTPCWFAIARALHDLPTWARYGATTLLVALSFLVHDIVVQDAPGYLIFFVPAVILSSLFLAQGSGIWAVLLSAGLIAAFQLPPTFILGFAHDEEVWAFIIFLATGLVTALTSEALHQAFFRIAETNTKLTAAYDRIAASEHEKEVLLHELTHRFKNDLANLTALLRLQARTVADPCAKTELISASERVHVMGRVHQRLTRFGEAAVVDIQEFITDCARICA